MERYAKLKELLTKETYPHAFPFKFIGKNTPLFQEGVRDFHTSHPMLTLQSERKSRNENHLSVTYVLEAKSPDMILQIYQKIAKLPDLLLIL